MKRLRTKMPLFAIVAMFATVWSQKAWSDVGNKGAWGDQGDGTYKNAILPGDFSDPDAIRVGSDYYMISSTFQFSPGVVILKSRDLVNWTIIGHAVDDVAQMNANYGHAKMNAYGRGIWAGAIRYHANKFWIYFGTPDDGYFMTTATDPAGPWEPITKVTHDNDPSYPGSGWDDCCPFWDDDGQGYLVGSNFGDSYNIHLWKMTADGKKLVSSTNTVIHQATGSESNKIYKVGDYYYFFHNEMTPAVREAFMLRAKNIWGDGGSPGHAGTYEEKKVEEDIAGDRWPNQGAVMQTESGSWWFLTHQGDMGCEGRPGFLLPVSWTSGWPVLGADTDKDGAGEIVWLGAKPVLGFPKVTPQASDEFSSSKLQPQWEWNYQPRSDMWSLTDRPGYLRLRAFKPLASDNLLKAGNTISQRYMRAESGVAVVKMDIGNMADGQQAGLAHFGGGVAYSSIAVVQANGARVFMFKNTSKDTTITGPAIPKTSMSVWLKSTMSNGQNTAFQYSLDGVTFTALGGSYDLLGADYRGDRFGIFSFNDSSENGYVDVDWFHYTYAGQAEIVDGGVDAGVDAASGDGRANDASAGTGGGGGSTGGATGSGGSSSGGRVGGAGGNATGGTGGLSVVGGRAGGGSAAASGGTGGNAASSRSSGCSCETGSGRGYSWCPLVVAVAALVVRRRARVRRSQ